MYTTKERDCRTNVAASDRWLASEADMRYAPNSLRGQYKDKMGVKKKMNTIRWL